MRELSVEPLTGPELTDALPALAALRIEVFRAYPYLYDGDLDYERTYIETFAKAPGAIIVVAKDGDEIVGASTGAPMAEQPEEWSAPFVERGYDLSKVFYCGESVLRATYRGQGIGHAFFDHREQRARSLRAELCCFCGVMRAHDHPLRPDGYVPLDGFWRKRGYLPLDGVQSRFSWKDIDRDHDTEKLLQFWSRPIVP